MWHSHDGPDGWGLVWMALMMAFVWIPILLIIVWAVRDFGRPRDAREQPPPTPPATPAPPAGPDAREIARRAYASGELDRERYLQIVEDLEDTASAAGKG